LAITGEGSLEFPDAHHVSELLRLVTPGIIITAVRARAVSGIAPELKDKILEFGVVSVIYGAVAGPLFHDSSGVTLTPTVWALLYSLVVPLIIGIALAYMSGYQLIYKAAEKISLPLAHHVPTAWDYTFSALPSGAFILVTLSDGTIVPGRMSKNSFASSSSDERDLLIEQLWEIDGQGNWSQVQPARSTLICGKDIRLVEVF
jgi:hypothetical protein